MISPTDEEDINFKYAASSNHERRKKLTKQKTKQDIDESSPHVSTSLLSLILSSLHMICPAP